MNEILRLLSPRRRELARKLRRRDREPVADLRYERFLAMKSYVRDDRDAFRRCVSRLRSKPSDEDDPGTKAKFLMDVLEANVCVYDGDHTQAAQRYRALIANVEGDYQRARALRFNPTEGRNVEFLSVVLALLHNNLAEILAKDNAESPEIMAEYWTAIEFQPALVMVRRNIGHHAVRRALWQDAEDAFREAYLCSPSSEAEEHMRANLATLRFRHAETLDGEGKFDEAIVVLERALADFTSTELHSWRGKVLFLIAEVRRRQGNVVAAVKAYEDSAAFYIKGADPNSASYVTEKCAVLHAQRRDDEQALAAFDQARQFAAQDASGDRRATSARLAGKTGILLLGRGRRTEGERLLQQARDLWREEGWSSPLPRIVEDARELIQREEAAMALHLYLQQRLRQTTEPFEARELIDALRNCHKHAPIPIAPAEPPGSSKTITPFFHVVTPLALEIDDDALTDVGDPDVVLEQLAPVMRNRLLERYGVKVPGIRLRANAGELPYGVYVLMIHEVPLASATIEKGLRFVVAERAALEVIGVEPVKESSSFDQKAAFWIREADAERVAAAGLEPWSAMEYPIRHLEHVIAENLVEFVGHQEVQNLLETNLLVGPAGDDIVVKEAGEHMTPLTNVVRALVSERVPIVNFKLIYAIFAELRKRDVPLWRIVEAIRRDAEIRPQLWGNDPSFQHLELGDSVLALVDAAVGEPDAQVLPLENRAAKQILAAVHHSVRVHQRPALVVARQSRRCIIRQLIASEFPSLPVLSWAELQPGLTANVSGVVEL